MWEYAGNRVVLAHVAAYRVDIPTDHMGSKREDWAVVEILFNGGGGVKINPFGPSTERLNECNRLCAELDALFPWTPLVVQK